jgi:hypothetical protein
VSEYLLSPHEYRALKGALTRALRSGSRQRVLETCQKAFLTFEALGYPDDWSRWERAKDDASVGGVFLP